MRTTHPGSSQPSAIPQNADGPTIVAKDLPSGSAEDSLAEAEEPESAFELGDLPVPEARASGFMVSPDGMGFTDEFLDAVHAILGLNDDVTISPHDPVFRPRVPAQDVPVQYPLKAKKAPEPASEPAPEVDEGPSAVPSEFVDPNAARSRSPPLGKCWALRSGQVDWKTTAEMRMLNDDRREAEAAAKAAVRSSKRRKLNRSDGAPTADEHADGAAGPSNGPGTSSSSNAPARGGVPTRARGSGQGRGSSNRGHGAARGRDSTARGRGAARGCDSTARGRAAAQGRGAARGRSSGKKRAQ
ncbi:hypothetical protein EWM64_g4012 [Hericium alpestre]|uniref:Uncharacterized protein n=1 Tax=Hericium alpestre TaxID=135208 RepID=A0A4Y9ZYU7_9AGAM|nr:hypothetical protein EWM64_g4012 [Hericium alpestre]